MKRLNKILIVFFFFCSLAIYGSWIFIHSDRFSDKASKEMSKVLTKRFGAKLSFTGVGFNFFPPATVFKNVQIKKNDPGFLDLDLKVESFIVSFRYSSFFSSSLEVDELTLKDGEIKINIHNSKDQDIDWEHLNLENIYKRYNALLLDTPLKLNLFKILNIKTDVNGSSFFLEKVSLAAHRKNFLLKIQATAVKVVDQIKDFSMLELDQVNVFLNLEKDQWKIENLSLKKGDNQIEMEAKFFNQQKNLMVNSTINYDLVLENILSLYPKTPKELLSIKGGLKGKIGLVGNWLDPDGEMSVEIKDLKSNWIKMAKVKADISKKKNILLLNSFLGTNLNERYELTSSQAIYDLKKNVLLKLKIPVSLTNAFTNTFLYAIHDNLELLKGYLTGKINIIWDGVKVYFEVDEKVLVKDFQLLLPQNKSILKNPGFMLEDTIFSLDKNFVVGLNIKASMKNSLLKATGELTGKELNISIKDSTIDMNSFGPIAEVNISGGGVTSAEIYGPYNNVMFNFEVDWDNFSVIDLNFGKVKSQFSFDLHKLQLDINSLSGIFNKSNFKAQGMLDFNHKGNIDLAVDCEKTNFNDAQKMYALAFKNITLPVQPEFNFSTTYNVRGGFNLEDLKINGKIKGYDLKVLNEDAPNFSLDFSLMNSLLAFKNIKILKSRGEINAGAIINISNGYTELEGSGQALRLKDFNFIKKLNLAYDGDLVLDFNGNGTKENFSTQIKTKMSNTFIENIPASSSNAVIYLTPDDLMVEGNFLSGKVKLDSRLNFKTREASIKAEVETVDLREFFGVFAGHNMSEKSISGKISAYVNSVFNVDTMVLKKFILDLAGFNIKKGDINLNVDPQHNSVAIENGIVKNWDLRFFDKEDFFISKARNLVNGTMIYDQTFSLKTSLLEFFTSYLDKTVGVIKGNNQLIADKEVSISKFELKGIKNSIKIKNLPGAITDLEFLIVKNNDAFEISKLSGNYGDGEIMANGTVLFDDLYPKVNIDYKIEKAMISLFKRSSLLVSSAGSISGTDFPYKLKGKVSMLYGEFLDDPSDFTKDNKINLDTFKKYLPSTNQFAKNKNLELDVSFETINPILFKNNLMEVYVKGSGQTWGNVLDPEINTHLEVIPTVSRFKFKGHNFFLNQGHVDIKNLGKNKSSDLKFFGVAKINDYDVKLDISGSIEKMNISLSSEPLLAQEDLVSLLTLGVTSDMSKNLEANDRKSVTTVGVGTLLVDQLKINEDLNSVLGLNLSVLPEFKEDETSLISGKSAVSESGSSKLKTATKIKIKKQISKVVDVSLSSTVGGSMEQTQEMNINYNINKNFSLEGVYEVKPAEEENTNSSNSIGADLKYRRSF